MTSRGAKPYEKGLAETACSFCKRGCCHFWFSTGGQGMEVSGDATVQRLLQRRLVSKGISLFQPVVVQRWAESQLTTDAFMGNCVPQRPDPCDEGFISKSLICHNFYKIFIAVETYFPLHSCYFSELQKCCCQDVTLFKDGQTTIDCYENKKLIKTLGQNQF